MFCTPHYRVGLDFPIAAARLSPGSDLQEDEDTVLQCCRAAVLPRSPARPHRQHQGAREIVARDKMNKAREEVRGERREAARETHVAFGLRPGESDEVRNRSRR
jgi:hypothetical protein